MPILEFISSTKEAYCIPHDVLVFCMPEHINLPRNLSLVYKHTADSGKQAISRAPQSMT